MGVPPRFRAVEISGSYSCFRKKNGWRASQRINWSGKTDYLEDSAGVSVSWGSMEVGDSESRKNKANLKAFLRFKLARLRN